MADLKQLTLAGAALDVPAALNDLTDVSASAPVAGQVLTFGDGGVWSPQANQAAGFPGMNALDWQDPLRLGMTYGSLPIAANSEGQFRIAKFQNQVFLRITSVRLSAVTVGRWYSIFVNVPTEWLPKGGNSLCIAQTWGPSEGGSIAVICAGNAPFTIWMIPLLWNSGDNYLHGIVTWYT